MNYIHKMPGGVPTVNLDNFSFNRLYLLEIPGVTDNVFYYLVESLEKFASVFTEGITPLYNAICILKACDPNLKIYGDYIYNIASGMEAINYK